jgi:filamentous hemagglutinin family protein
MSIRKLKLVVLILAAGSSRMLSAEVVTDGTVGAAQNLAGPNFLVPQTLGTRVGNNLFHSFTSFNLSSVESATFTGDASTANVISRVTGNTASSIDGLLRSQIGTADFYFINPAGVVFGTNAQVDVPASFYVSTANELQFADGAKFSATAPQNSTLTAAAPIAFGFLGDHSADISFTGNTINLANNSRLSVSASNIQIAQTNVTASAGELLLTATGQAVATVAIDSVPTATIAGGAVLLDTVTTDLSGDGGGIFAIQTDNLTITDTDITLDNTGTIDASEKIALQLFGGNITIVNAFIQNEASGSGGSGNVNINVETILFDDTTLSNGSIFDDIGTAGNGGDIQITANNVINNDSFIASEGANGGNGGNITVNAKSIIISDAGLFSTTIFDDGIAGNLILNATEIQLITFGGISSATAGQSQAGNTIITANSLILNDGLIDSSGDIGKGGDITLTSNNISITNGMIISSDSFDSGDGGNINITGQTIVIDGEQTLVSSDSLDVGNGGSINIAANSLTITNGAVVTADASDQGLGGNIQISGNTVLIDGTNAVSFNGISTQSTAAGNSGSINIALNKTLIVTDGGKISATAFAAGDGGEIVIKVPELVVQNSATITSNAEVASAGQTGNISITGDWVQVRNQGVISIDNKATVSVAQAALITQSSIDIQVNHILIGLGSSISAESFQNVDASNIVLNSNSIILNSAIVQTNANNANGGAITISGGSLSLFNSQIATSVAGQGDGGDIIINSTVLTLDTGFIQANTAGLNAVGGDITINSELLIASNNQVIIGGNDPIAFVFGLNVIQAASADGLDGNVDVAATDLDVSGSIASLDSRLLSQQSIAGSPCSSSRGEGSTLSKYGKGGLPAHPSSQETIDSVNSLSPTSYHDSSINTDNVVAALTPSYIQSNGCSF